MSSKSYWKNGVLNFFDNRIDTTWKHSVWADCPLQAIQSNPELAHVVYEDFGSDFQTITDANPPTLPGWTCTQGGNTLGHLSVIAGIGGLLQLDSESTTQHEGLHMQQTIAPFKLAANKDLWFEAKVRVTDTFDKCEFFCGLAKIDGTLIKNDGDLDTGSDYVGFAVETTLAGVTSFYECKDTAELKDSMGTAGTLPEADWIQFGFKIKGVTGIQAYIDNVEQTLTNVIASGIPTTDALAVSFVCQTDATNDPLLAVDWVKCIQLR